MTRKQHLAALLSINMLWFVYAFVMLVTQGSLFLNPDGNPSMSPDLSFNTAISLWLTAIYSTIRARQD